MGEKYTTNNQIYKPSSLNEGVSKDRAVPQLDLYNCKEYVLDQPNGQNLIWKGANFLSRLSDEEIISELKRNYRTALPRSSQRREKGQVWVIYHPVRRWNSNRFREPGYYDGFFEMVLQKNRRKFYTTWKSLIQCIEKERVRITKFHIVEGYSDGGEHLRKEVKA